MNLIPVTLFTCLTLITCICSSGTLPLHDVPPWALGVPLLVAGIGGGVFDPAISVAHRFVVGAMAVLSASTAVAVKIEIDSARRLKGLEGCGVMCGAFGKQSQELIAKQTSSSVGGCSHGCGNGSSKGCGSGGCGAGSDKSGGSACGCSGGSKAAAKGNANPVRQATKKPASTSPPAEILQKKPLNGVNLPPPPQIEAPKPRAGPAAVNSPTSSAAPPKIIGLPVLAPDKSGSERKLVAPAPSADTKPGPKAE